MFLLKYDGLYTCCKIRVFKCIAKSFIFHCIDKEVIDHDSKMFYFDISCIQPRRCQTGVQKTDGYYCTFNSSCVLTMGNIHINMLVFCLCSENSIQIRSNLSKQLFLSQLWVTKRGSTSDMWLHFRADRKSTAWTSTVGQNSLLLSQHLRRLRLVFIRLNATKLQRRPGVHYCHHKIQFVAIVVSSRVQDNHEESAAVLRAPQTSDQSCSYRFARLHLRSGRAAEHHYHRAYNNIPYEFFADRNTFGDVGTPDFGRRRIAAGFGVKLFTWCDLNVPAAAAATVATREIGRAHV